MTEKTYILAYYRETAAKLALECGEAGAVVYLVTGADDPEKRALIVGMFREHDKHSRKPAVLVGTYDALSVGGFDAGEVDRISAVEGEFVAHVATVLQALARAGLRKPHANALDMPVAVRQRVANLLGGDTRDLIGLFKRAKPNTADLRRH